MRNYPSYYKPRVRGANKLRHFYTRQKSYSKKVRWGKLGVPRPSTSYRGKRRNAYFGRPIPRPSQYRLERKELLRERSGKLSKAA